MRVLHLYAGNLFGGVESVLVTLARHRAAVPDMEPVFALAFEGRLADELRAAGAEVHLLGGLRLSNPLSVIRARRRLRALLRAGRFDVAVAHAPWSLAAFGPVARRAHIPLALWMHDAAGAGDRVERLARRVRPDLAVCNSAFTAATLPALYPRLLSVVVHPPVPPPPSVDRAACREQVRRELGTSEMDVVFVQVGRMEAWKGHATLVRALGAMRGATGWTAWLVGGAQRPAEAAYLAELKALAASLGVAGRIVFTGERTDVPRVLAAADVACQPNLGPEPFGVAIVEALHAGLPVVASAAGGAVEIVTEECGVLVAPDSPDELRLALARLAGEEGERRRLGAAGPRRAAEVSDPTRQMGRLADALSDVSRRAETR